MADSEFELVLDFLKKSPDSIGREVSVALRKAGHDQFTPRYTNQTLYRMLAARVVERDGSREKPRWSSPGSAGTRKPPKQQSHETRPLDSRPAAVRTYLIANTEVRLIVLSDLSPNDPYMTPDWVGSHVVASVNSNHPFWISRIVSDSDRALYSMLIALDAYVQWKIAQLSEPPDASETQQMRDFALRFCTLVETEVTTTL
jgi:hypothetical protein